MWKDSRRLNSGKTPHIRTEQDLLSAERRNTITLRKTPPIGTEPDVISAERRSTITSGKTPHIGTEPDVISVERRKKITFRKNTTHSLLNERSIAGFHLQTENI